MSKIVTVLFLVLLMIPVAVWSQTAVYDTVSIYDLQYVSNPDSSDTSPYEGDTVVVKGIVQHQVRDLWVGARWACYLTDGTNDPWSGFFIIQNDTSAVNTLFGFVQPGDECWFTGIIDEYAGFTELALLTDPVVPITIVSGGNTLPSAKLLTLSDLETHDAGEQWESVFVRVENTTVTNSSGSSNQAFLSDATGTGALDDYFWFFREKFNNGTYEWPANGTNLNVNGFTRDIGEAYFSINPRDTLDLEVLTNPPQIDNVVRDPGVPTSFNPVTVSASIVDNVSVTEAKLYYSVDWGAFTEVPMSVTTADTFAATIPPQANNSYVRYFLWAVDNDGDASQLPGDTSAFVYSYVVRDGGLSINDVQYTWGYSNDASPYRTYDVTLEGVVTTDTSDWVNNYYIQSKDSAWYGLWVYDPDHKPIKGDWVSVSGTIQENYGVTRMEDVTSFSVVTPGYGVFSPIEVTTGEISTTGDNGEAYESVLIKVSNLTVSDPFPDDPGNYGEFSVDDGTGSVRVDDAFSAFGGNLDSTYHLGDTIQELIGVHYYSFSNYKILPRDTNDVVGHVVGIENNTAALPEQFELQQNYPNPFNPLTTIRFNVPQTTQLTLNVYNMLGQKVKTLYSGTANTGSHSVQWDATNDFGNKVGSGIYFYQITGENISITKKMVLLK